MPCCTWEEFCNGLKDQWRRAKTAEILIDWREAKIAWRVYAATPGEVARYQINRLKLEGEYVTAQRIVGMKNDDDEGGGQLVDA